MGSSSPLRLDLVKKLNQTHRRIAALFAQGETFDEVVKRSQLRPDKIRYLLLNAAFKRLVNQLKGAATPDDSDEDVGSLTLAQLASKERRKSILKLAEIRDASENDTARVQAASAIINQTKDIPIDEEVLHAVATPENVERMVQAAEDVKWFARQVLEEDRKIKDASLTTTPENVSEEPSIDDSPRDNQDPEPGHEIESGPEADPGSLRQVPICI